MSGMLSVRKTLVLGLGSTGLRVAEQLAEHLTWQYGSFEKAAWVRILVLETAQPQSKLGDRVLWGGMTKQEYLPYLTSPRTTGADFGFSEWQDGATLGDIDNPSDGAGNCRMLGRLCLFHPRTYSNLHRRVSTDISYLGQLTPQAIAESLGEPGRPVTIHEGGTVVYVVGTLCGGTGSGGAADLGYLMDVWGSHSVSRQAIFTVPHPGLGHALAPRYKKNAFYALKELNHFQLGDTVWSQRLPGFDQPAMSPHRPYDILRVVMPPGPAEGDVSSLNAMIGQYLAAAVGPAGFDIAASDVDARGKMIGAESIGFMRPLFSTMGVAALEYPGEHIQRAATNRLLATAYARWCGYQADADGVRTALGTLGATNFDAILQRLQEGAEQMSVVPFQQLFRQGADQDPPKVEQVRQLLREVDTRLTAADAGQPEQGTSGAQGGLPSLLKVIQGNHQRLLQNLSQQVQQMIQRGLLDLEGGPGFVAAVLRQYLQEMESWPETAQRTLPEYRQDTESLRDILNGQIDEVERDQKGFSFNKKQKLRQGWETVAVSLYSYLSAELKTQTSQHLQRQELLRELVEQYRKVTAPILKRLDQMQVAFSQEAAELERSWKELAKASPSVNGKVYFDAEPPASQGTVTREYFGQLSQARWPEEPATGWNQTLKEEAALKAVLATLDPLREELAREPGRSAFDERPGVRSARETIPEALLTAAETRARSFFAPLREQAHITDKASDADIDTVVQASVPRLSVSAAQVSDRLAGVRGAQSMPSYLAFLDTADEGEQNLPTVQKIAQRVANSMHLRRGIIDSNDPFRLLILREQHGFTLGQMEGVIRSNQYDNHALQSAEGCNDFKFWHTRRDVDWVDPLIPPRAVEATEEDWLLTVLLGRPADSVLGWLPSSLGEIEPAGWYDLVAGHFYVFYAPGCETSERGGSLPLSYPTAVAKLLHPDYELLRRTLRMRLAGYSDRHGHTRVVQVVDQAIKSLGVFGITDLDSRRAERIMRRAYRRSDGFTRAFFDFRTQDLQNVSEFAHLRQLQGAPIQGRENESYPADGYYCPTGHLLGSDIQKLRAAQFLCPVCNTGERYWP